ncbi:MAG: hypothetical protein HY681_14660 [Chloroflexi bacterium]|nr:hypothetical protein [Chloroflexota bacterium]
MSDGMVLSQEEIDRMLSTAAPRQAPPGAATARVAEVARPAAPATDMLSTVTGLAQRVEALERAARDGQGGASVPGDAVQQLYQAMQKLAEQIWQLAGRVDQLSGDLQATPGNGLQKSFSCGACGTSGNVATQVKCTNCGETYWWGWYPKQG